MQIHDTLNGFTVTASRPLPELHATLWEMTYDKNGARLCWLDRDDTNKSFAITFRTVPSDDTGVFHILEHSVLCGSDKFPTKEPFVELLKGSLQTFLNALTFPDKTMYPVSSRNDRDFLNLTDVYMDAVLHPAIYRKPAIFRQEGWHYAFEGDTPSYNGVVFNEMKGAYADVETVMYHTLSRALFPDTCYRFSSGGDPTHIPELSYEQFIESHRTYYHPSNAYIFLDGAVNLDDTLALLDRYLRDYDRLEVDSEIPLQAAVTSPPCTVSYEAAGADDVGRVQLAWGYVCGTYADRETAVALRVLTDVLCGSNESPLKKAVLSQELAEDIYYQSDDGTKQPMLLLEARNVPQERVPQLQQTVTDTLTALVRDGLPRDLLTASLNCLEFRARERDFGTYSRGVVYAMTAMESWLYGGDPAQNLCCDEVFASLRQKLTTDYFERLLDALLLKNPHCAQVCLTPSTTLGEETRAAEAARVAAAAATWDEAQRAALREEENALHAAQAAPDTPEQLRLLPQLTLDEVETLPEKPVLEVQTVGDCTALLHPLNTDGLCYATLYFSAADLTAEEMACAAFLCDVLGNAATAQYSRLDLHTAIHTHLGRLSITPCVFSKERRADDATLYVTVDISLLESKKAEALSLLREILCHSELHDKALLRQLLRQNKLAAEESLISAGHSYALGRTAAACTAEGAVKEYLSGIENMRWTRRTEAAFDTVADALCAQLSELCRRLFCRERLTVSVTGETDEDFCRALTELVPLAGGTAPTGTVALLPRLYEGVLIPSGVSYAVESTHLSAVGGVYSGALRVAANILSLDYLWNNVRVQGGAYGAGFIARPNGLIGMYSYRDPQPARSLSLYAQAADALERFCDGDDALTPYIIGTVADTDPLLTTRSRAVLADSMYFTGRTQEDRIRLRREILGTTREQLRDLCAVLRRMNEEVSVCVVGGQAGLDACGDRLSRRYALQDTE